MFLWLVLSAALGWSVRGIFDAVHAPWWGTVLVSVPVLLLTLIVIRRLNRSERPPSLFDSVRPKFEDELADHLHRYDLTLTTREQAAQAWPHIFASPHVRPGQWIFANPDDLARLTRGAGPEMIKAFQEWGERQRRATSPFLRGLCTQNWSTEARCATGSARVWKHRCAVGLGIHGPKCVCSCGESVERPGEEGS